MVQIDAFDEAAIEKEEDHGKVEDVDCNHDIRIHEDLGHVCRVCGMIVRRAESIIDYQWKKVCNLFDIYIEGLCSSRSFGTKVIFMHACSFHFGKILSAGSMLGCSCLANGLVVNSYIGSASLMIQTYRF